MRVLLSALFLAQAFTSAPAYADCNALFNALDRADQQPRVAHYGIERRDQALTAKPVFVRVGQATYYGVGADYERIETDGTNPVLQSLRQAAEQDAVRCSLAGSDMYRGASVEKISFDDPTAPAGHQSLMTFWIDKRSGLPLYQQFNGAAPAVAWIYEDVTEPTVGNASLAGWTLSHRISD